MRFADGEAADGVAGKIKVNQSVGVFAAQACVRAALHDAKDHLAHGIAMLRKIIAGAARPSERTLGGIACAGLRGWRFNTFVENHHDVRAECDFNFERFFGR